MSVDAKDLTEAGTDIVEESLGKAVFLAKPFASRQRRQRSLEICGSSGNRSLACWSSQATRSKCRGSLLDGLIDWECFWIMDLAAQPTLNKRDVLGRSHRNRGFVVVKPGISMTILRSASASMVSKIIFTVLRPYVGMTQGCRWGSR